MIARLLQRLEKSDKPILTRYYVLRSRWLGIKIHHIKQSDPEFHTHPWWGLSIIFGAYREQRLRRRGFSDSLRWLFNIVSPWDKHRVVINKPVWTIFIHGPRVNENWVYGNKAAPWRGPDKKAA